MRIRLRHLAWLLLGIAQAAMACGQLGVADQVSSDGKHLSRKLVAIKEQARRHGGYEQAARDLGQMHRDLTGNDRLSAKVRRRLELDFSKNVAMLNCWSELCSNQPDVPDCRF